jgi:hypothetical protein
MNKITKLSVMAAAAILSMVAGCQTDSPEGVRRDAFVPDDQPRQLRSMLIAQEAAGARRDATLHACDFNIDGLNSLGQQKLDLMLTADEPTDPITVYVDFADAEVPANTHHSVTEYLKTRGVPDGQVVVKDGSNPGASTPAADAVAGLHSISGGAASGATATGAGAPAAGAGAAGGASSASTTGH